MTYESYRAAFEFIQKYYVLPTGFQEVEDYLTTPPDGLKTVHMTQLEG